jgi:hypothetical protein
MLYFVVCLFPLPSVVDDSVESVLWWIELFAFLVFRMENHFTGCVSSGYALKPRNHFRVSGGHSLSH